MCPPQRNFVRESWVPNERTLSHEAVTDGPHIRRRNYYECNTLSPNDSLSEIQTTRTPGGSNATKALRGRAHCRALISAHRRTRADSVWCLGGTQFAEGRFRDYREHGI